MNSAIKEIYGFPRAGFIEIARGMLAVWSQREVGFVFGVTQSTINCWTNEEVAERKREYSKNSEVKAAERDRRHSPKYRAKVKDRQRSPKYRAKVNDRRRSPEFRVKRNERKRNRWANDPQFRLQGNLRRRLHYAMKGKAKRGSAVRDMGCTADELFAYFELNEFYQPGQTKENYGKWVIDHLRPLASFDLEDPEQIRAACHFTNLRPAWPIPNIQKGSFYDGSNWSGGKRIGKQL
jgi:hypothetical protein